MDKSCFILAICNYLHISKSEKFYSDNVIYSLKTLQKHPSQIMQNRILQGL